MKKVNHYFPFKDFRTDQQSTIEFVAEQFDKVKKKSVMVEMPTGGGKSAVAFTIASYYANLGDESQAFIITPLKMLQDQYNKDFGHIDSVAVLKGKNNYKCKANPINTCEDCTDVNGSCYHNKSCHYKVAVKEAIYSKVVICNLHSYYYLKNMMKLENEILCIDEAHTVEKFLMSLISVVIKHNNDKKQLTDDDIKEIIKTEILELESIVDELGNNDRLTPQQSRKLNKATRKLDKLVHIFETFDNGNWAFNIDTWNKSIEIQPVKVDKYFRMISGNTKRLLFLSATLPTTEVFADSLGLSISSVERITTPCRFPVANRHVYLADRLPSFSYSNIMQNPNIISEGINIIRNIINYELFKDKKGLIITHSNKFMNQIIEELNDDRLIPCSGSVVLEDDEEKDSRIVALKKHIDSDKPTILTGSSLYEGLDLKDDLCRFNIIFKCPYPMETDQIKKRRNISRDWYSSEIALKLVQGYGRGVRNEKDWCYTFNIDSAICSFLMNNEVPSYIRDSFFRMNEIFY